MSYTERYALTENGSFRHKLQMAIWIAAVDVTNEPPATADHAKRLIWAKRALRGPIDTVDMLKVAIRASANAVIGEAGTNASDSDIQFVVNALVDELT